MRILIDSNIILSACLKEFLEKIEYERFSTPRKVDVNAYPATRDASDVPILASALLSDADILLTADKDFGEVNLRKPLIFTPNQYFELITEKGHGSK